MKKARRRLMLEQLALWMLFCSLYLTGLGLWVGCGKKISHLPPESRVLVPADYSCACDNLNPGLFHLVGQDAQTTIELRRKWCLDNGLVAGLKALGYVPTLGCECVGLELARFGFVKNEDLKNMMVDLFGCEQNGMIDNLKDVP